MKLVCKRKPAFKLIPIDINATLLDFFSKFKEGDKEYVDAQLFIKQIKQLQAERGKLN